MHLSDRRKPLVKTISWYSLICPVACVCAMLYDGFDWKTFLITFALTYPLWCFGVQSVKFFEDCIIVFRPFIFCKKIILYEQVDHIKEVTYGRTTAVLVPYDVYIYIKGKKQPTGISMPSSSQEQERLRQLIASKDIQAEWGIFS